MHVVRHRGRPRGGGLEGPRRPAPPARREDRPEQDGRGRVLPDRGLLPGLRDAARRRARRRRRPAAPRPRRSWPEGDPARRHPARLQPGRLASRSQRRRGSRRPRCAVRRHEHLVPRAAVATEPRRKRAARLGVRPEDRVLLALSDGPEFVACWYAALKVGAVVAEAYTFLPAKDYAYYLGYSRARVVIVDGTTLANVREAVHGLGRRLRSSLSGPRRGRVRHPSRQRPPRPRRHSSRPARGRTTPRSGSSRRARPASRRPSATSCTTL